MTDNAIVRIQCPKECMGCLSCLPDLLRPRLRGKFIESGAPATNVEVFCQGMSQSEINVPVSGLSLIPFQSARRSIIKLIEYAIRNHVDDRSISIRMIDQDDVDRLKNSPPKFTSRDAALPLTG